MIVKLIGAKRNTGEYDGRPYDKLVLFCSVTAAGAECAGVEVLPTKKTSFPVLRSTQICSDIRSYADFFQLVGKDLNISFNQFGNVDTIQVISD